MIKIYCNIIIYYIIFKTMTDPVSIAILSVSILSLMISISSPLILASAYAIRKISHSACIDCNNSGNNSDNEEHHIRPPKRKVNEDIKDNEKK